MHTAWAQRREELGPTGGNVRCDAIASISCIDKVLQASIAICGFKRTLQKFPTSTRTGNSGAFWRHFSGFFGHFRVVSTCIAGSKVKDGTMDSRRAPQMRSRHTFPPAGPKEGRVSRPPFYQCTPRARTGRASEAHHVYVGGAP